MYVDEAQDLCEVQWMLLARMVRHPRGLFFAGDPYQALRPSGFHWNRLRLRLGRHLHVTEGSLALNLRNTRQIAEFVQSELERVRARYQLEHLPDYHVTALMEGLPPAVQQTSRADASQVAEWLGNQGALIVWDKSAKSEQFAQAMQEHGTLVVTVDEAKGLELDRAVVLDPYTNLHRQMQGRRVTLRQQAFSRLYVALTRARRGLLVLEERKQLVPVGLRQADAEWWRSWQAAEPVLVRSVQAIVQPLAALHEREGMFAEDWLKGQATLLRQGVVTKDLDSFLLRRSAMKKQVTRRRRASAGRKSRDSPLWAQR
ncbi:MAG: hypothetical protein C4335_04020 [Armatimonadota bacterium]